MLLVACLREPLLHRCTVAIAIGCEGIADAVPTPDEFVEACIDKMQRGALAVTGQPVIQQGLERHTGVVPHEQKGEGLFALEDAGVRLSPLLQAQGDRKSTRLNSSHTVISYAVFC